MTKSEYSVQTMARAGGRSGVLSLVAACALMACSSIPADKPYQRPALGVPSSLSTASSASGAGASATSMDWLAWWKTFQDPVLDALLVETADHNQDLALATARIAEARATLNQNTANLYPTVDVTASANRRRGSENSASYSAAAGSYSGDGQLGLTASYEIDFWGKFARADEAARARLLGQSASRGVVLTTLYANVAQSYFAVRSLDAQLALAEQTMKTRQENVRLQQRRLEGGVAGELDVRLAQAEAASVEANMQLARQNRSNAESALAVLLGRKPADILNPAVARGAEVAALVGHAVIPSDLPSDLLTRRPDVVSAEQNLVAANADIGQARTAYFPKLSLTATLGQQSKELSTLFDPASVFWSMVGNLTQPIFRAGAIDAVMAAANAREQQAVAQYTQTVQNAFRDVHDALNNVAAGREISATTLKRMEALRTTLRLSDLRFKAGYSSYLDVLNAQRDLFQAESGLIDAQRSQLNAIVNLYKAVGGGWDATTVVGQMARP